MGMKLKEMAKHFRNRLRHEGIPAKCHISVNGIEVCTVTYESRWTSDQIRLIAHIAKCNGMTLVRGLPIDVDLCGRLTEKNDFHFYMGAAQ